MQPEFNNNPSFKLVSLTLIAATVGFLLIQWIRS